MPQTRSTKKRAAPPTATAVTLPAEKPRRDDVASSTRQLDNSNNEDSPASRVLQTYELLEQILVKLPLKDLFVLQRVNPTWKDLMRRSERIQKKMFLLATGEVVESRYFGVHSLYDDSILLNPILRTQCDAYVHSGDLLDCDSYLGRAQLVHYLGSRYKVTLRSVPYGWVLSARDMFLTQPPISAINFWTNTRTRSNDRMIRNAEGITFGDLIGARRDVISEYTQRGEILGSEDEIESGHGRARLTVEWTLLVEPREDPDGIEEADPCPTCRVKEAITS